MTKDDVIRMAREAGHSPAQIDIVCRFAAVLDDFAALVRADEREACAKVCESFIPKHERFDDQRVAGNKSRAIAAAIRARGQA
jgi:hypothetical protein